MLIREFISETNKNQMISRLLKHYKVGSVKLKYKSMKDFAHLMLIGVNYNYLQDTNQLKKEMLKIFKPPLYMRFITLWMLNDMVGESSKKCMKWK